LQFKDKELERIKDKIYKLFYEKTEIKLTNGINSRQLTYNKNLFIFYQCMEEVVRQKYREDNDNNQK